MKKIVILFLIFFPYFVLFSQKDLLLDRTSFGCPLFEKQNDNFYLLDKSKYPKQIYSLLPNYAKELEILQKINILNKELNNPELIGNQRALIYLELASLMYQSKFSDMYGKNETYGDFYNYYNIKNVQNEDENIVRGATRILNYLDEAIKCAENNDSKMYIIKQRMDYIHLSGLFSYLSEIDSLKNNSLEEDIKLSAENHREILTTFQNDYIKTNYLPLNSFVGLDFGVGYLQGKQSWIGGEIAFGFNSLENKTKKDGGVNFLGLGFYQNLNQTGGDFTFYTTKIDNIFQVKHVKFNLNVLQFGYHTGSVQGNGWFYRPELGIRYNFFSLNYGYNYTFNNQIRPLTEKHFVSFKLSYPLIRLSKYQ
jgi:hypothetical protein